MESPRGLPKGSMRLSGSWRVLRNGSCRVCKSRIWVPECPLTLELGAKVLQSPKASRLKCYTPARVESQGIVPPAMIFLELSAEAAGRVTQIVLPPRGVSSTNLDSSTSSETAGASGDVAQDPPLPSGMQPGGVIRMSSPSLL